MMLDKKQIWMIFFFKFKLGRKTVETIRNINNAFSPGTANECTVQWCFKKFCKRDKSLETRSMEACHRKLTMTSWAGHQSWSSYSYRRSCPRNSMPTILWSFCIWKQIGKVKKHSKWVLHTSTADQKSHHLASLVLCNHSEPFLSQTVMCDEKWNLCHNWWWPAQWLDWEFPKHFPKPNWHRKSSWSLFGGLLLVWPTTAFWIPVKPLPLGRMLSKSVRCVINCNVCRSYCSTERNKFFSTTTPSCMSHSRCIKGWTNWVTKFCLIHHIHLKWRC